MKSKLQFNHTWHGQPPAGLVRPVATSPDWDMLET